MRMGDRALTSGTAVVGGSGAGGTGDGSSGAGGTGDGSSGDGSGVVRLDEGEAEEDSYLALTIDRL